MNFRPRGAPPGARASLHTLVLATTLGGLCGVAAAHSNGTVFSSPVDGDGAALFWNPAAMALSPTSRVDFVANLGVPQATYQRFGVDSQQGGRVYPKVSLASVRPEPHLGLIIDRLWHSRLRLGISVTVPSAVGAAWPESVDDGGQRVLGPTRYHVTGAQIFHVYTQLGASIAVHPTLSLGFAVNVVLSRIQVDKHIDLANQVGVRDALPCAQNPVGCENPTLSTPLHLAGTGASAGGSVGILWQPLRRLRIGVGYISPTKVKVPLVISLDSAKLEAFARSFLPGYGTLAFNGSGTATVTVPQRLHVAVAVDVHPRVELMAMFRWVNYSATEIISGTVTEKSSVLLPDALEIPSVRNDEFMATLRVVGRVKERTRLGCSIEYVSSTVPDEYMTPANLDFHTVSLNLGARVRVWRQLALGASFSQTIVVPRTITSSAFANTAPEPYHLADPSGRWTANSERLGLDISSTF